jgi:hypothetical protein
LDQRTFAVVIPTNYLRDRDYLRGLLRTDVALHRDARTRRADPADLDRSGGGRRGDHRRAALRDSTAVAGLDLGAEGPDEIAQAIVRGDRRGSGTAEAAASSRNGPARSTTGPRRAPKRR